MKGQVGPPPAQPLPVIVKPFIDELLSSWLSRTGHLYGISTRDLLGHLGIEPPVSLRHVDFAQPPAVKARLAWGLRTTTPGIQRVGHSVSLCRAYELVAITNPLSRCPTCDREWRNEPVRPLSRSWYEAWRIACGFCHRPFHRGADIHGQGKQPFVPESLWQAAVHGSKLFDRYLLGRPCGWLPPQLILKLASAPIRSAKDCYVGFRLIVPEAAHPAYSRLHTAPTSTCRTTNPFKRLALLGTVHRFNQDPQGWLRTFSEAATQEGRATISAILAELPHAISAALLEQPPADTTLRRELLYACQTIEIHQIRVRLAANLTQIRELCVELSDVAVRYTQESRS